MRKKEIELIYNSDIPNDKEALAVLESLSKRIINEFDVKKMTMTPRQIAELANDLDIQPINLIDKQSKGYLKTFENLSTDDLLSVINKNMTLLKTPNIREDGSTKFLDSSYSEYAKDLKSNDANNKK